MMLTLIMRVARLTAGFKSLCANPLSCMKCKPSRIWEMICCPSFSGSGVLRYLCKSPSGRYSMVINMLSLLSYQPKDLTKHSSY